MSSLVPMDRLIHLIFEEQRQHQQRAERDDLPAKTLPLVTLTHDYGSGAEAIGRALAEALGVPCWGDSVTYRHGDPYHLEAKILQRLDTQHAAEHEVMAGLLAGRADTLERYRRALVQVLLHIAEEHGGVIVDRGAHMILRDRPVFRLRIVGSDLVCAHRIAAREGIREELAREKLHKVNRQRRDYLRALVGQDDLDPRYFDLTLNTDHFPALENVHLGLVTAMRSMGLLP